MKKIALASMLTLALITTLGIYSCKKTQQENTKDVPSLSHLAKSKDVDFHVQTINGCDVHIKGTVDYTIIPPAITGFHGTVTIGSPCEEQVLTFKNVQAGSGGAPVGGTEDLYVEFNSDNPCTMSTATWYGTSSVTTDLNTTVNVNTLVAEVQAAACEE